MFGDPGNAIDAEVASQGLARVRADLILDWRWPADPHKASNWRATHRALSESTRPGWVLRRADEVPAADDYWLARELWMRASTLHRLFRQRGIEPPTMPVIDLMIWATLNVRIAHDLILLGRVSAEEAIRARTTVPDGRPLLPRSYPRVLKQTQPLEWIIAADEARLSEGAHNEWLAARA